MYSDDEILAKVSKIKQRIGNFDTIGEFVKKYKKACPYPSISTLKRRYGSIRNLLHRTLDWEYDNLEMGIMSTGEYISEGGLARMQINTRGNHFIICVNYDGGDFTFRIPRK